MISPYNDLALFDRIFSAPTSQNLNHLNAHSFPYFIAYLFQKDGRYAPTVTDANGGGDGNVDIELRSIVGLPPILLDIVQCKLYNIPIGVRSIREFSSTVRHLNLTHGYFFTRRGFTGGAQEVARRDPSLTLWSFNDIIEWIKRIHERNREQRRQPRQPGMMPIPVICFTNNKGGVGKTTLTVNIADALARMGLQVLVIDADPQSSSTYWIQGNANPIDDPNLTLSGVITKQPPLERLMRASTRMPGVYFIPCHGSLSDLSEKMNHDDERAIMYSLADLSLTTPPIDIILIDTQPDLTPLTRAAIVASNFVIFPFNLEEQSKNGVKRLISFVESAEKLHGVRVKIEGGIATAVKPRNNLAEVMFQQIPYEALQHDRLVQQGMNQNDFWVGQTRQRVDYADANHEYCSVAALKNKSDAADDIKTLAERMYARVKPSNTTID